MKQTALVVFGEELPRGWQSGNPYDIVVASEQLRSQVQAAGLEWEDIETFVEPGSIYEASAFAEELSRLTLPNGSRITKSCVYKGYELWWMNYNNLFHYFCLPYTQYKKLLMHLGDFKNVYFYRAPYASLFSCYLQARRSKVTVLPERGLRSPAALPFGVLLQILLTLISLPILVIQRHRLMVFTGDKFEKDRDYDFRLKFIYEELRRKNTPFVEFIRGLEPWRMVVRHAFTRGRPVVYSEAVAFIGRFISILSGGQFRARREFGPHLFSTEDDTENRFKQSVAMQYLLTAYDDIWAIRIMKWILRITGVKAAFVPAALERNFHTVLGCKLNTIPIVGILHGVSSCHYNIYDFMPGFDGEKSMSVDIYGLWSEWWREYYLKNSSAYKPEQFHVSGPMRPLELKNRNPDARASEPTGRLKVLFIGEQLGYPTEVLPYLLKLLETEDIDLHIKFRFYRDSFEEWLKRNHPELLTGRKILRGNMQEAISLCDVAVGSHSTAVLEALLQLKPVVFYDTQKWGDYYELNEYDKAHSFFAESPEELIQKIHKTRSVSVETLKDLQTRYFGDPYQNGSAWVVAELEKFLR